MHIYISNTLDVNEGIYLLKKYIYDKTGKSVLITPKIMADQRQLDMLSKACKIAVEYYKNKK